MSGKWSVWESEKQIYLWIIWWGEEAIGPIRKLSLYPLRASSAFMQNSEEKLFLPFFSLLSYSLCFPDGFCVLLATSHTPAAWSDSSASARRSVLEICFAPEIIKPLDILAFFSPHLLPRYFRKITSNITSYQEKKNSRNYKLKRYEGHVKTMQQDT